MSGLVEGVVQVFRLTFPEVESRFDHQGSKGL